MSGEPISVLFVCLGNICRSPMAEGIFRHLAQDPKYRGKIGKIDSCGTAAYHAGEPPDDRTLDTLEKHDIFDYEHLGRRILRIDFEKYDYIFAMDRNNLSDLQRMERESPGAKAKVQLFGEYSGTAQAEVVSDPYYGEDKGFDKTFEQCHRFATNFLKDVFGE
ncbi:Low molecular weight phosphotyrosine protein phosphatase [Escovopsis weberi]|uniref:Low molecular weight phosphotyrosine protein phosphatase n=1 Tax=Escovopsis weberi TaxID=150374 RepID=A0A0M8N877_ESCWE|nr:Low molecular weight phosphotyrosine protein phosphatase [Escovopsis weberi]